MSHLLSLLVATGTGAASALVPVINAEAYAMVAAARSSSVWVYVVMAALAVGQTAGKLVLFESARRGTGRWSARFGEVATTSRGVRWATRVRGWLGSDHTGGPLVFASAAIGLPPLAIVSLASGASSQRRWVFATLCLAGRTLRFAAIVRPTAYLLG